MTKFLNFLDNDYTFYLLDEEEYILLINEYNEIIENIEEYKTIIEEKNFGAGEDFTYMLAEVQKNGGIGSYIQAGVNRYAPHHNNKFNFDNEGLRPAVEVCSIAAYNILKK